MLAKIVCSTLFVASCAFAQGGSIDVTSPSGKVQIHFGIAPASQPSSKDSRLIYSVTFDGKPLIETSGLKLELDGQKSPLGTNVRIVNSSITQKDQSYKLVSGKASSIRDHFFEARIDLEDGDGRKLAIEARAYDDAVAFRYIVPEQSGLKEFRLKKEATEFRLAKDATTYALELPNYRTMYESEFIKLPASGFANQGGVASSILIGCPLLIDMPGVGWAAITDADLKDYAAMYLTNPEGRWSGHWFESRLAPQVEHPEVCVTGTLPHQSAWRVIMVADHPAKLIESNVLTSLNPESQIADTSWIKPGKASWDWWSGSIGPDGQSAFNTDTMKFYVDFAAKSGLQYMLIDAGWSDRSDVTKMNGRVDVPEVVKYAAEKNVKVWIWMHYNAVAKQAQREQAFPVFEKWGVVGLKIDFVERDDQDGMDFYYRTAELAAKHHLMLDFHGCTKPTGMERTWPNILGYEAVLGMEQSKGGGRDNPDNRLTIPFTRMLAGFMDYTPGGFDNVTRDTFEPRSRRPMVMGTRAHHLAMYAVYLAPIQMVSDCPQNYEGQEAFEFIRQVPATWDQTVALNGEPGEFVTVARRHGEEWYLGSMTNWKAREIDVPLDFLGTGKFDAHIYADADDADRSPRNIRIEKKSVDAATRLRVRLAPAGGCAIRFIRSQL